MTTNTPPLPAPVLVVASALPAPVLVVEDIPAIHQRLENILSQIGYMHDALIFTTSLAQAREYLKDNPVSLALVDLGLPDGSGLDLISALHLANPALGIVVISAWSTPDIVFDALMRGASGYVIKERSDMEISMAIRSVLRGGAPIDPFIARRVIDKLQAYAEQMATADKKTARRADDAAFSTELSSRELQILTLVSDGHSNREIAEQLFLSRHTIDSHVRNIYQKLQVSTRTQAVFSARSLGLIE